MWQYLVVGLLVLAATVYAARKLGPRSWRAKQNGVAVGGCGCDKAGSPCQDTKKPGAVS